MFPPDKTLTTAIQQLLNIASRPRRCLAITELREIFTGLEKELVALIILRAIIEVKSSRAVIEALFSRPSAMVNAIVPRNQSLALSLGREPNATTIALTRRSPPTKTSTSYQRPEVGSIKIKYSLSHSITIHPGTLQQWRK